MSSKKQSGCGCGSIPISVILLFLGGCYWWLIHLGNYSKIVNYAISFLPNNQQTATPIIKEAPSTYEPIAKLPQAPIVPSKNQPQEPATTPTNSPQIPTTTPINLPQAPISTSTTKPQVALPQTGWDKKVIRGIYLSRYQVTNNADEQTIRERVRYYRAQGLNTIIHGVWGNGCTMYNSDVLQQILGFKSCPNQFQDKWLDWMIDEAHKQGMQVHAYFEKGIKIDKNSPIYDLAVSKKWLVPGVDKTYAGIDHYVLDVQIPEVANLFKKVSVEFVQKYPTIDAVQWDDYLGYHAELPGQVDRTAHLTKFVQEMIGDIKKTNPKVSFDVCHHNPYWAKRYFAADLLAWKVDRIFIQAYNDANFQQELNYAQNNAGVAITDYQFGRLKELIDNNKIKSILIFPFSGKPEETAKKVKEFKG
jgi:uncharacterized lipoprotein YddW (UPF0748 family)